MNIVDANVLIYAVNTSAEQHERSRAWLDRELSGGSTVAFTWGVLLAFLRLVTKPGLFASPMPVEVALSTVRSWLAQPSSVVLEPTRAHLEVLSGMLAAVGTGGNLTSDAHLAALAIEHRATIITFDSDFARFPGVASARP